MYPLVLAYRTTIHKFQGSTLEYILGNLNCATNKGPKIAPVYRGPVYTLLSHETCCRKIKVSNFGLKQIKCNHEP